MLSYSLIVPALIALAAAAGLWTVLAMMFRVVVPTNEMHIVQSGKRTVSYGKDQKDGNTYYKWPSWVPHYGIRMTMLPVSVFPVKLDGYPGYDKGRVPFIIDIMAFFRITNSDLAAQRVSSLNELLVQLQGILQGACRSILASSEIEEILEGRSKFGGMFTKEVDENLSQWGVQTVKCIELMDIRDAKESNAIHNIMAKKQSLIEMQSRVEVAKNNREAQLAEITATQVVEVSRQEAEQLVGVRTAEKNRDVGIATQQSQQSVKEQEKVTAEREMAVKQVTQVRAAEIAKEVRLVEAEQNRQATVLTAEGELSKARLEAQGVEVEGAAKGAAEQAVLMAPVNAQIKLAEQIGSNAAYQHYLIAVQTIEKDQAVGIAQAQALTQADIKVFATSGTAPEGLDSIGEVLTPRGGVALGSMLEGLASTPVAGRVVEALSGQRPAAPNGASK